MILKLTDASAENRETGTWLDIIQNCEYASYTELIEIRNLNTQISKLLYYMINNPQKFSLKSQP
jgi:four helix bundle protein